MGNGPPRENAITQAMERKTVHAEPAKRASGPVGRLTAALGAPMGALGAYYAKVLGRDVGRGEARAMVQAQVAILVTAATAGSDLAVSSIACAWFILALRACRRAARKG